MSHGDFGRACQAVRAYQVTGREDRWSQIDRGRAMCLARIFGIPGGLGNPLGTEGGGGPRCEHVHPAPVDVEDRAVDEGGLV